MGCFSGLSGLGIASNGVWVIEGKNQIHLIDSFNKYLCCVSMLETPAQLIIKQLQMKFGNIIEKQSISMLFPFYEIIEFTLSKMEQDYWFELAMVWYEILEDWEKIKLEKLLLVICRNKKFSQKNRQTVCKKMRFMQKIKQ